MCANKRIFCHISQRKGRQVQQHVAGLFLFGVTAMLLASTIYDLDLLPQASSKYGRRLLELTSRISLASENLASSRKNRNAGDRSRKSLASGEPHTDEVEYQSTTRSLPPGYKQWLEYAKDRQCHLGPYRRIDRELQVFRDPGNPQRRRITREQLLMAKQLSVIRYFRIHNGVLYNETEMGVLQPLKDMIDDMQIVQYLPDMDFVVTTGDLPRVLAGEEEDIDARFISQCTNASSDFHKYRHLHGYFSNRPDWFGSHMTNKLVPIFSYAKIDGCHSDIQIPSPHHYNGDLLLSEKEQEQLLPWGQRADMLYFRGTTSGGHFAEGQNLTLAHRPRLVKLAKDNPHMDMEFTSFTDCLDHACKTMEDMFGRASYVQRLDYFKSKFLMAADGSISAARIPKLLSSGSVVFKAGLFNEWFDEWFRPREHFLQIDLGYQNLQKTLDWALQHDREAEAIGKRGRQFALQRLRKDDMRCYMYRLLLEYAAILD